jgi:hypothetical protein
MFNIKWGGICACVAFLLALTLSLLLGQTNLLIALLRAVIFAALFFGLGIAIWALIKTFLPELLSAETADIATHLFSTGSAGSRVNITVGDTQSAALPKQSNAAQDDVGDFNELFTPKDVDQIPATGYTEGGATEGLGSMGDFGSTEESAPEGDFSSTEELSPIGEFGSAEEFASSFDDATGANDEAEDEPGEFSMDFSAFVPGGLGGGEGDEGEDAAASDLDSFSFFPEGAGSAGSASYDEPAPERKISGNKPMKLEGDFNAKEIAAGLRTVLEKDKK